MRPSLPTLCTLAAMSLSAGCASLIDGPRSTTYSNSAKENYERGVRELKNENWLDAAKYFQYTKTKYGFSKYAPLAQLGMADTELGRERWPEAVDGYKSFMREHPRHERVEDGYAAFQIGMCFYKQIPSEWFLVPPSTEKDQGPVRDALRELRNFVKEYADSKYAARAATMVGDCEKRLAEHELYVAHFYLNRDKPKSAIGRLEGLLADFPDSAVTPEVLLTLAQTHLKMNEPKPARAVLERLIAEYPTDFHARQASLYLKHIAEAFPGA